MFEKKKGKGTERLTHGVHYVSRMSCLLTKHHYSCVQRAVHHDSFGPVEDEVNDIKPSLHLIEREAHEGDNEEAASLAYVLSTFDQRSRDWVDPFR